MERRLFTAIALLLVLSGSGFALTPVRNIVVTPGYPKYPDQSGLAEVKVVFWHDTNGVDVEVWVELFHVSEVNGKRAERSVGCCNTTGWMKAEGAPSFSLQVIAQGTYFFRCKLKTIDPTTGKPNPDIVRVTPDTIVKFK